MTEHENLGQNVAQTPSADAPAEKMLPQSVVSKLIGEARHEGREFAMREFAEKQAKAQSSQPLPDTAPVGLSEDAIRKIVMEQTAKAQQEALMQARAQQIVQDFAGKMASGGQKYSDFEQKVSALDLPKIPQIVQLVSGADNTADIMYELANNPHKVASLLTLARETPHLAQMELQKLSRSIKENQKAVEGIQPREPMTGIKPSSGPTDKGPMTLNDFRKAKWARK